MRRTLLVPTLLLAVGIFYACGDDPGGPSDDKVEYGSAVTVGNGTARSYIITAKGKATELGVALSEQALQGLPGGQTPMDGRSFVLPLPASNTTGYKLVELNWNPVGHPPPMVYTVPHFDVHFYVISQAARDAIVPSDPDFGAKGANLPPQSTWPSDYIVVGGSATPEMVPRMGVHWADTESHEFHGSPFDKTFIIGSWDGGFTFVEPMVTLAFLESKPSAEDPVKLPGNFASPGDRPTGYRVAWNAGAKEYRIGLTKLGGN